MFASERVRLRPQVPDDAAVLYEMWSDPEHHLLTSDSPVLPESLAARRAKLAPAIWKAFTNQLKATA